MAKHTSKTILRRGWFGGLAAAPLAMILAGCGPEGAGTVDVGNPKDVRSKVEGDGTPKKKLTARQAKVQEVVDEAIKKHPKLE